MIKKRKISFIVVLLLLLAIVVVLFGPFKTEYKVVSKVTIKPALEWELTKTIDGNIITVYKDNINNTVNSYSVTEFQRGDVVEFRLNPDVLKKDYINKGDTIGFVFSNEEQRKLIELEGNLKVLDSEYKYYTTGQKPEDVDKASKQLILAKKELETQQKLMARSETLFKDSIISPQQYDIDSNELEVREMNYKIAKANYKSVTTGEKPEQAELIKSKIYAQSLQLNQLKERLDSFILISPISGKLAKDRYDNLITENSKGISIVRIIDTNEKIGVSPIRLKDLQFFELGSAAFLPREKKHGTLIFKDNIAQTNWNESSVFLTFIIKDAVDLNVGSFTDINIYGKVLSLKEYLKIILRDR